MHVCSRAVQAFAVEVLQSMTGIRVLARVFRTGCSFRSVHLGWPTPRRCTSPPFIFLRKTRGRLHHLKEGCNETGCEGEASLAGDTDLQAWNALFTEAILAESPGLIDRPTALKQPDGQWRGVISTTNAGERKTFPMVSRTPPQFPGRCAKMKRLCSSSTMRSLIYIVGAQPYRGAAPRSVLPMTI